MVEHLGQLDFLHARENVGPLGPPGTGKTHLAIALSQPVSNRRERASMILSLKGDSYRLRGEDLDTRIGAKPAEIAWPRPRRT